MLFWLLLLIFIASIYVIISAVNYPTSNITGSNTVLDILPTKKYIPRENNLLEI